MNVTPSIFSFFFVLRKHFNDSYHFPAYTYDHIRKETVMWLFAMFSDDRFKNLVTIFFTYP